MKKVDIYKFIFIILKMSTQELDLPEIDVGEDITNTSRVILYNDEWHTFDDVINQIIKAIGCSKTIAENMTWEVHNKGKTRVYEGGMQKCLKVSSVLEEIALNTNIEF